MKQIPLTAKARSKHSGLKLFALVDDEDYHRLSIFSWTAYRIGNQYYAYRVFYLDDKKSKMALHREIMECKNGDGKIIDHKDGNALNNQKYNLRFCTTSQNAMNKVQRKNGSSKYKGVWFYIRKRDYGWRVWFKSGYRAGIVFNGKQMILGHFKTEEQAALAYNDAAKKYYGEFARLNII